MCERPNLFQFLGLDNKAYLSDCATFASIKKKYPLGGSEWSKLLLCVEPQEARHRREAIITIRKGGVNDDEEGRDVGRGDGIYPDSFRRKGLL